MSDTKPKRRVIIEEHEDGRVSVVTEWRETGGGTGVSLDPKEGKELLRLLELWGVPRHQ